MLLSSFLNSDLDYNDGAPIGGGDWAYVLYLPTETATAWYHHALPGAPGSALAASRSRKLRARRVPRRARPRRADWLPIGITTSSQSCTAIPACRTQYIRNSNLRIPYDRFESELMRQRGTIVGRIDSRFKTYLLDRPEVAPDWDRDRRGDRRGLCLDQQLLSAPGAELSTRRALPSARSTISSIADGNSWDFKHGEDSQVVNVTPDLAQTMTYNPSLKVFSANGYFDFATPFFATQSTRSPTCTFACDTKQHHLRLLRVRTYGLSPSGRAGEVPRRFGTLVRVGAPLTLGTMRVKADSFLASAALAFAGCRAGRPRLRQTGGGRPAAGAIVTPDAVTQHTIALDGKSIPIPPAPARSRSKTTRARRRAACSTRRSRSTASIRARVR